MLSLWQKVKSFFVKEEVEYETVRARTKKGRFVADDKSTPDVNEAYKKVAKKKTKKKSSKKK
jgi:hypothetical protein|tara:strand:+ start:3858 stop:4043 length:186 start_codon:yes stop_codon:yes gene_type:complete